VPGLLDVMSVTQPLATERRPRVVTEGVDMLFISVGIAFLLLFGVLIFDGISSSYAGTSAGGTDVSSRTRKPEGEAARPSETTAAVDRSRSFGDHRPDDGTELAA
jgi:hypothetical protein